MAYRRAVAGLIVTAAMALAWTPGTLAERGQSIEDVLQSRIRAQPQQLQPYIDVASFYYSERRYDDFDRTLASAIKMIRQAQVKTGASTPTLVPPPTPAPRRIGFAAPPRFRDVKPVYPADALQRGVGGTVHLELAIDPRGLVTDARVTRSVPELDAAALAAARLWEFAPSFEGGQPAPVILDVRLTFIPEPFVTVAQTPRRQVAPMLAMARRHFDQGAYTQAEHVIDIVLAAGKKERTETPAAVAATTAGITTTEWPIRGGRDVKPPARTRDAQVVYPPQALQQRLGGFVTIDFVVNEQGKPAEQRRSSTTSPPILEQAVRDAFQQWEYAPTMIAGTPVPIGMSVTFAFQEDRGTVEEVVRVGGSGDFAEPKKIKHVPPRFPEDAQRQRIQGVIVLEAVIDRDGKVGSLRLVRSAGDVLDRAAVDAVRQWEFVPMKMYGVPMPVAMTVTVNFSIH